MLELKKTLSVGNVVNLAISAILVVSIAGCGSENGGAPMAAGVESSAVITAAPSSPVNVTGSHVKFVDDSFASAKTPDKPVWDDTAAIHVQIKNDPNGEMNEDTIMVAINEIDKDASAQQGGQ